MLIDSANKTLYQNTNTQASPSWKLIAETTASGAYVGTFDGAIGGNTPAAGSFTSLKESLDAVSTQGAAIGNSGITSISSTDIKTSYPLAEPVAGIRKRLELIAVSSGVQIIAAPATFDGTNSVAQSTMVSSIVLSGLSTARWAIDSVYPQSTAALASILTLSTST